jgi:hypothetical protein
LVFIVNFFTLKAENIIVAKDEAVLAGMVGPA